MEVFLTCVAAIALGELGDRTQLLALVLSTRLRRPFAIILGILVATLANHLLAAWLGQWAGSLLRPQLLRLILGLSFLVLAVWVLVPDKPEAASETHSGYGAFLLTLWTFFLAEMGDKTQLLAMSLAARFHDLLLVVGGTTVGMMLVNVPTVLLAERVTRALPLRWIRLGAAGLYAVLGVVTLLGHADLGPPQRP